MSRPADTPWFLIEQDDSDVNLRTYHTRAILLDDWQVQSAYKGVHEVAEGVPMNSVLDFAIGLDGVSWGQVTAYSLRVRKAPMTNWDDIDAHLINFFMGSQTWESMLRDRVIDPGRLDSDLGV